MSPELLEILRTAARRLFRGGPVLAAYAFGSRVAGHPRPDSDLDVGYYLHGYRRREQLPIREEMLLAAELTVAADVEVDFRNLADAPLELRGKVLEEGVRIYSGHDAERVALERELLSRYHDYKDTFRRMHRIRLRRLAAQGS
jgi:predicted nucleotidyltransferase